MFSSWGSNVAPQKSCCRRFEGAANLVVGAWSSYRYGVCLWLQLCDICAIPFSHIPASHSCELSCLAWQQALLSNAALGDNSSSHLPLASLKFVSYTFSLCFWLWFPKDWKLPKTKYEHSKAATMSNKCMHWKLALPHLLDKYRGITRCTSEILQGKQASQLLPNPPPDTRVMNVAQHKVAFSGCLPITAVVIIPVHSLCWRISAPWTNVLHCLGNNLCSCWCWIDDILIIRLESKSLEERANALRCRESEQQVGCIESKLCAGRWWNNSFLAGVIKLEIGEKKIFQCFLSLKVFFFALRNEMLPNPFWLEHSRRMELKGTGQKQFKTKRTTQSALGQKGLFAPLGFHLDEM